jgi:hypothetical protein
VRNQNVDAVLLDRRGVADANLTVTFFSPLLRPAPTVPVQESCGRGRGGKIAASQYVTWALSVLLLTPTVVSAQTEAIQKDIDQSLQQARMYEDIEIMRRLLHRKIAGLAQSCQKCHGEGGGDMAGMAGMMGGGMFGGEGGAAMMPGPMMAGTPGMPGMPGLGAGVGMPMAGMGSMPGGPEGRTDTTTVDGVHIPGQGVVFQVEAPALLAMLPPKIPRSQPKPKLSEWEVIRKQLRGEKIEAPAPADNPHEPNFQQVITSTLAEHGKNFRALGDKEKLTVAVTFRTRTPEPAAGGGAMPMGGMAMPGMAMPGGEAGPMGGGFGDAGAGAGDPMGGPSGPRGPGGPGGIGPMSPMGLPGGEAAGGFGPGVPGGFSPGSGAGLPARHGNTSKDHELLADYHIRQGRYDEAAQSLLKAIALNTDVNRSSGLQRKLAISYLMQDQYQRPDADAVAKAMAAFKKALEGKKTGTAPSARPLALPQRLIITVPRQALQTKSLEGATIEWLRFDRSVLRGSSD